MPEADKDQQGYFLFDSLRDPRRLNETKIHRNMLSGTLNEFKKISSVNAK